LAVRVAFFPVRDIFPSSDFVLSWPVVSAYLTFPFSPFHKSCVLPTMYASGGFPVSFPTSNRLTMACASLPSFFPFFFFWLVLTNDMGLISGNYPLSGTFLLCMKARGLVPTFSFHRQHVETTRSHFLFLPNFSSVPLSFLSNTQCLVLFVVPPLGHHLTVYGRLFFSLTLFFFFFFFFL